MSQPVVYTYLKITSEVMRADEIASSLSLTISEQWAIGDRMTKQQGGLESALGALRQTENGVVVDGAPHPGADVEESINLLLNEIETDSKAIIGLGSKCDVVIQTSCTFGAEDEDDRFIRLSPGTLQRLAKLGVTYNVDLY